MLPIRTILYPTAFSEHSGRVFQLACSMARDHGAQLYVLHVMPPPMAVYAGGTILPMPDSDKDKLWNQLRRFQDGDSRLRVQHLLVEGNPAETILRVIREIGCDLVLMGTHRRTGLGRLLMGSVAEQVVRKAPCPVMTIKIPEHAGESDSGRPVAAAATTRTEV
jgi:nucleotide-binding universal stress UspA family protein